MKPDQKKPPRKDFPEAIAKRFKQLCKNLCVACNLEGRIEGHLNDDRSNNHPSNFILLCDTCNNEMQRELDSGVLTTHVPIHSDSLRTRAYVHFLKGSFIPAYMCHKLSAHVYITRWRDPYNEIQQLSFAIGALRPLNSQATAPIPVGELLQPLLTMVVERLYMGSDLILTQLAPEFISHFGMTLMDHAEFDLAEECGALVYAWTLQRKAEHCRMDETELAREGRRIAFSQASLTPELSELLALGLKFETSPRFDAWGTFSVSVDVESFHLVQREADPKTILDLVLPVFERESEITNKWVAAELHRKCGDAYFAIEDRRRAVKHYQKSAELILEYSITLEPRRTGATLEPNEMLRHLGKPRLGQMGEREPFPLSRDQVRGIIRQMGNRMKDIIE